MRWPDRHGESFKWHSWFAWHPVRCGKCHVWLEVVQRRRDDDPEARVKFWEYRLPESGSMGSNRGRGERS